MFSCACYRVILIQMGKLLYLLYTIILTSVAKNDNFFKKNDNRQKITIKNRQTTKNRQKKRHFLDNYYKIIIKSLRTILGEYRVKT